MSDDVFTTARLSGRKFYTTSIKGGERFEIGDRIKIELGDDLKTIRFTVPDDRTICKYTPFIRERAFLDPTQTVVQVGMDGVTAILQPKEPKE